MSKVMQERLRDLRQQRGLSQEEVAFDTGIAVSQIGCYERGYRKPGLDRIIKLAKYFNVTTDYLMAMDRREEDDQYVPRKIRALEARVWVKSRSTIVHNRVRHGANK